MAPGDFLIAAICAGGQVTICGAGERATIVIMSPSWMVISNPKKVANIARDQGYSTALSVTIQQARDAVVHLTPNRRIRCNRMNHWPPEQPRGSQSAEAAPLLIHENSQAREWVRTMFLTLPPNPGATNNQELPSSTVAEQILGDWGITTDTQVPIVGRWLEEHITASMLSGRPISWQWDVTITMLFMQMAGIHKLFTTEGEGLRADALVKSAGLAGNVSRRATLVSWKAGMITTKPGFQAPGSMCLVKDLHDHQLEKGIKHLGVKSLDLLIALSLGIQLQLGDRYKPAVGRKTGPRVKAVKASGVVGGSPAPSTPVQPTRRGRSANSAEGTPTYAGSTAPFTNTPAASGYGGATPVEHLGIFHTPDRHAASPLASGTPGHRSEPAGAAEPTSQEANTNDNASPPEHTPHATPERAKESAGENRCPTGTYAQAEPIASPMGRNTEAAASEGESAEWVALVRSTKGQSRLPFAPPPGLSLPGTVEASIQRPGNPRKLSRPPGSKAEPSSSMKHERRGQAGHQGSHRQGKGKGQVPLPEPLSLQPHTAG
jgi:hypothetical protein